MMLEVVRSERDELNALRESGRIDDATRRSIEYELDFRAKVGSLSLRRRL
jgi:hypothetical protein